MAAVVLLGIGMGIANAAVFKLVPFYVPKSIGGAASWVGGLGAFGGFVMPPIMGAIAGIFGSIGYAPGFVVFVGLSIINLAIIYVLFKNRIKRTTSKV